ncbi:MAG: amidase [Chthoniobacterales bacterium]
MSASGFPFADVGGPRRQSKILVLTILPTISVLVSKSLYLLTQRAAFGLLLTILLASCALPVRQGASRSRARAFIAYQPPTDQGRLRLAVKDLIDVKGFPTTAGSEYISKIARPAEQDAACLAIARRRGVQIVGKTNLSEFAVSPSGINEYFGTPQSPFGSWLRHFIPGGSSSGSAAAITGGLADVALGTDTTGSVRIPAACSGIVGLKTTFGLVPLKGVFPISPDHLDTIGPMAKDIALTVRGMDLLEEGFGARYEAAVAAKPSGQQIKVGRLYLNDPSPGDLALVVADPGSVILGATDLSNLFYSLVDPTRLLGATDTRIDQAVDAALAKADFQVVRMDAEFRSKWAQAQKDANVIAAADAWLNNKEYAEHLGVSVRTKSVLLLGEVFYKTEYKKALGRQKEWQRTLNRALAKVDFIALPTMQSLPLTIPLFGSSAVLEARVLALQNASAVNLAGNPALAIPIPIENASVPVTSLQLVGRRNGEAQLLNAGRLVEASNPWER